jgi:hypothetical protein
MSKCNSFYRLKKTISYPQEITGIMIMVCPHFDDGNNLCTELGQKFYEGMQKPCLDIDDPEKCPILMMRG